MNKRIKGILIFIILFLAFITTVKGYNNSVDVLDQEQSMKNSDNIIFCSHIAQSFKPTRDILTKIELYINRQDTASDFVTIGVRESLNGSNLTTTTIPTSEIPLEPNYAWIQFDFQDVNVIPEKTYYIIFFGSEDLENPTNCNWGWYANGDVYFNGEIWLNSLNTNNWYASCRIGDMSFKTYGLDEPPGKPSIIGETSVKIGIEYEYKFMSNDPDGDNITYCIDWGDNTDEVCIGPYISGVEVSAKHNWSDKGTYIIKVKAKDYLGAESDPATLKIRMLKTYSYNQISQLFLKMIERFPFFEKILKP